MKLIGLIVLGALVAVPATAQAAASAHRDAKRDVQRIVYDDMNTHSVAAPKRANGDIREIRTTHTRDSVRVSLRFRELARSGLFHWYEVRFRAPDRERSVGFNAHAGRYPPGSLRSSYWSGSTPEMSTPHYRLIKCRMTKTIDYGANTVSLVVPRRCLGNPRWVRVGVRMHISENDWSYFDDAYGSRASQLDPMQLGPRVRRD